jgi:hypothetical protein
MLYFCPISSNICQLRIDFKSFVITGPSTSTLSETQRNAGVVPSANTGTAAGPATVNTVANWKTNCLIDTFTVSGKSIANSAPAICGTVDGTHMYVDANAEDCNVLSFNFMPKSGPAALGTNAATHSRGVGTLATRKWDMTIYQYECGYTNAAPPGCTQYVWGPATGVVQTYNFGNQHLANQNQKICIRREKDRCYACFAISSITNFRVGGENANLGVAVFPGIPCGYGCEAANGIGAAGNICGSYDCAIVPGAFAVADMSDGTPIVTPATITSLLRATYQVPVAPQITGTNFFGPGNTDVNAITDVPVAASHSICTKHVPFQLTFKSNDFEGTGPAGEHLDSIANSLQTGFSINYALLTCT